MVHVCVLGENRQYSEDTLLKDVAKEVQENVKSSIESMTGLRVVEINVHVGGVTFKPSASAEEKAKPAPSETETPAETADAE